MSKFWSNLPYNAKSAVGWTTGVYTVVGLVAIFTDLTDLFPQSWEWWHKMLIGIAVLLGIYIVCLLGTIVYFYINQRVCILTLNGNHHVYVQYGNVFSPDVVNNPTEKRHIVINANRCFDTIVNEKLVSSQTLHGRSMNMLYEKHRYTQEALQQAIDQQIAGKEFETLERANKPQGNLKRYVAGTIVPVDVDDLSDIFYLGMSSFDENLSAHTTMEDYIVSIQRMLEYCYTFANGFPVVITLMGGGLARTGKDERQLLDYLVQAIKINKDKIAYDLHLVVYDKSKDVLPIAGLK